MVPKIGPGKLVLTKMRYISIPSRGKSRVPKRPKRLKCLHPGVNIGVDVDVNVDMAEAGRGEARGTPSLGIQYPNLSLLPLLET